METTTIEISVENWKWLSTLKQRPGDSFDDVLRRIRQEHEAAARGQQPTQEPHDSAGDGPSTNDESEQPDQGEVGPEGMTMDAGEALFADIEPADVPDDLDLPGSDETFEQRRQAIGTLVAYLRTKGTATKADFLELVDADAVGYASAESFWSNAVKGRDSLSALDGVVSPSEGGHNWRYEPDADV